ncbi:hypothetical protein [Aminicella lysinilytica]|mgnify:FL=1|uniref:DUF1232 domain-containing protein n=1 Tax=Aminicella lysinilytica TaxID=433323 RepID=A0A4R6QB78_9FIRM|nr:hypothetical protein [Aminicella lysinilytica]TDP59611.1 hypothetical protein EV211_10332 [Aminicella lysinilytica]
MQYSLLTTLMNRIKAIPFLLKDKTVLKRKKALVIFGIVYVLLPINWIPPMFFTDELLLWIFIIWHLKDDLDVYWKKEKNEDLSKKFRDKDMVHGVKFTVVDGGKSDDDKNDNDDE